MARFLSILIIVGVLALVIWQAAAAPALGALKARGQALQAADR